MPPSIPPHRRPIRPFPRLRTPSTVGLACLLMLASAGPARADEALCRPGTPAWVREGGLQLPWVAPAQASPAGEEQVQVEADHLAGQTSQSLVAEGRATLRRGVLSLQADRIEYQQDDDRVNARGAVRLQRDDNHFLGTELELQTEHQEGYFLSPRFYLGRTQAGGRAERVDFIGRNRMVVRGADYSSCELVDGETPAWVLTARRVRLDFDANEGVAEGAVLRFQNVPILALPVMSFPVTDARKSGWLPPMISTSSNSGLGVSAPYYWNIAPEQDMTLTPTLMSKRGAALETEYRYLQPGWSGEANLFALPNDLQTGRQRWALHTKQRGELDLAGGLRYDWSVLRVSDGDYWKDGLRGADSLTPRLLSSTGRLRQNQLLRTGGWLGDVEQRVYARVQQWQVLQDSASSTRIATPYQRAPQVGVQWSDHGGPLQWSVQTEVNRFTNVDTTQIQGSRAHLLGQVALPLGDAGWRITPKLSLNSATYQTDTAMSDGRRHASRTIPGFSLDSAWTLERETAGFGRALLQTLEPRLLYALTPWRDQSALPNFDSAALDFNATTVFSDNVFSGIDRVSDAHQVTAGLTTRFLDRSSGAELARFGIAQRYLLRDQRITSDGVPLSSRLSDVLLQASVSLVPSWTFDTSLQFNPDTDRLVRTITSARWAPQPLHSIYLSHRLKRGTSEQLALAWQWPLSDLVSPLRQLLGRDEPVRPAAASGECRGKLYGVSGFDYSLRDSRMSSAIVGLEYDAGCWIGRFVARRQSTSAQNASTQLMLQLELVGLSRLSAGSNPLSILKDNIPGYQLLRDPRGTPADNSGAP
ncbi:MAG: LPS-assembly protein [Pseudomonadota bacterium]|nr:LPS-assembly protein [Pseudomonadota bacterium]